MVRPPLEKVSVGLKVQVDSGEPSVTPDRAGG